MCIWTSYPCRGQQVQLCWPSTLAEHHKLTFSRFWYSTTSLTQPRDNKRYMKLMMTRLSKWFDEWSGGGERANIFGFDCSRHFNDRRMGSDVDGEVLAPELKGYILRITGGNDKQGFTMKQGILVKGRVRILMKKSKCHHTPFFAKVFPLSICILELLFNTNNRL